MVIVERQAGLLYNSTSIKVHCRIWHVRTLRYSEKLQHQHQVFPDKTQTLITGKHKCRVVPVTSCCLRSVLMMGRFRILKPFSSYSASCCHPFVTLSMTFVDHQRNLKHKMNRFAFESRGLWLGAHRFITSIHRTLLRPFKA